MCENGGGFPLPLPPVLSAPQPLPTATETELRQLMTHRTAERSGTPPTAKLDRAAIYQQAMGYAEQLQRGPPLAHALRPHFPLWAGLKKKERRGNKLGPGLPKGRKQPSLLTCAERRERIGKYFHRKTSSQTFLALLNVVESKSFEDG